MKILLDTSAYSAFKRGIESVLGIIQSAGTIIVPVVVLGELKAGFKIGTRESRNIDELNEFLSSSRVSIADVTAETTEFYAELFRQLRKKGTPVPTNDLWIASLALEHGCFLSTMDDHFRKIPGIIIRPE
jgi:predicted nucleic acid-binding protein